MVEISQKVHDFFSNLETLLASENFSVFQNHCNRKPCSAAKTAALGLNCQPIEYLKHTNFIKIHKISTISASIWASKKFNEKFLSMSSLRCPITGRFTVNRVEVFDTKEQCFHRYFTKSCEQKLKANYKIHNCNGFVATLAKVKRDDKIA